MSISPIWKNRDEELIHQCLEEAFTAKGYRVRNIHSIDRPHESGVDVECQNPEEKIAIQAKIKPTTADILQLQALSKVNADKRIYVSVDDATVAFKNEQDKTKNVEFWDAKKLNDFLIDAGSKTYFRLLFLASEMVHDLIDVLDEIASCQDTKETPIETPDQLAWWWLFKDRAVKIHGMIELIYEWYKTEFLKKDAVDNGNVRASLAAIIEKMNHVHWDASKDLVDLVRGIKRKYPSLLSKHFTVCIKEGRSNWIRAPDKHDDSFRKGAERWIVPPQHDDVTFYHLSIFYLKNLTDVAEAIEDGVDWVLSDSYGIQIHSKTIVFDATKEFKDNGRRA